MQCTQTRLNTNQWPIPHGWLFMTTMGSIDVPSTSIARFANLTAVHYNRVQTWCDTIITPILTHFDWKKITVLRLYAIHNTYPL